MAETIIYLDHAATSPLHPDVLEAMLPWMREGYGNPGSLHRMGARARRAVADARAQVAALIGAAPQEIIFTAGGTEADNLAIAGVLHHRPKAIITSPTEHHAVLHAARRHGSGGAPPHILAVDSDGRVDLDQLEARLADDVAMVSIMHGNNETGVMQPVDAIAIACARHQVIFHCDAVQSVGHLPVDVATWPVQLLAISAHKISGPKGIGALFVRKRTSLAPLIVGGGQESNLRAGTENVAAIVGFAKACTLMAESMADAEIRYRHLGQRLEAGIRARIPQCWVNGGKAPRLPHILNVGLAGVAGEGILYALDAEGICVSTGSACTSGVEAPSHVLRAMNQSDDQAASAVRFSFGLHNTEADIDRVLNVLPRVVQELRAHEGSTHVAAMPAGPGEPA